MIYSRASLKRLPCSSQVLELYYNTIFNVKAIHPLKLLYVRNAVTELHLVAGLLKVNTVFGACVW
jgi:hypothetical protein